MGLSLMTNRIAELHAITTTKAEMLVVRRENSKRQYIPTKASKRRLTRVLLSELRKHTIETRRHLTGSSIAYYRVDHGPMTYVSKRNTQ